MLIIILILDIILFYKTKMETSFTNVKPGTPQAPPPSYNSATAPPQPPGGGGSGVQTQRNLNGKIN